MVANYERRQKVNCSSSSNSVMDFCLFWSWVSTQNIVNTETMISSVMLHGFHSEHPL